MKNQSSESQAVPHRQTHRQTWRI